MSPRDDAGFPGGIEGAGSSSDAFARFSTLPRWVVWREVPKPNGGRPTKPPFNPTTGRRASHSKPEDWTPRATAERIARMKPDWWGGYGIVLGDLGNGEVLCGADLDTCLVEEALADWAKPFLRGLPTYGELSPSGTGLKMFWRMKAEHVAEALRCLGIRDGDGGRKVTYGDPGEEHPPAVEIYLNRRFFTITHKHWHECEEEIALLDLHAVRALAELLGPPAPARAPAGTTPKDTTPADPDDVQAKLKAVMERRPRLAARYAGDTDGLRDTSRSGYDMSLGGMLKAAGFSYAEVVEVLDGWEHGKVETLTGDERERYLARIWDRSVAETPEQREAARGRKDDLDSPDMQPEACGIEGGGSGRAGGQARGRPQASGGGAALILNPGAPLGSAREFVARHHTAGGVRTLHHQNSTFYTWTGSHYAETHPEEMRATLYRFLDGAQRVTETGEVVPFDPTKPKVAFVLEATAAEAQIPGRVRPPAWLEGTSGPNPAELVACANGLLHLPTRKLHAHSAAFFNLNALPFGYRPDVPEPEEWLAFLKTIWPSDPDAISTLQELFGLCLTADTRHQKAFLIVGPKRSGKGTIARILTELLGAANVCGPTLSSLGQNFGLATLIGKRLAVISDARLGGKTDQQVIVERILAITGEDSLSIDRKHREAWTGKLDVRFVVLTNELPKLTDASGALAGRFVILTMTHSFYGKEDLALTSKLTAELPGILAWAIEGWKRLTERGHFVPPKSSEDARRDLEDLGSPIQAFLRDRCVVEVGAEVRCDDFYQAWCDWCREHGREHPGTTQTLSRDLNAAIPGLRVSQPRDRTTGRQIRHHNGVRLATAQDAQGGAAHGEQPGEAAYDPYDPFPGYPE